MIINYDTQLLFIDDISYDTPSHCFTSIIAMFCLTLRILSFSYMHDKSIGCRLKFEFVAMELLRLLN